MRTTRGPAEEHQEQRGSESQKPYVAGGTNQSRTAPGRVSDATLVFLVPLTITVLLDGRVKRIRVTKYGGHSTWPPLYNFIGRYQLSRGRFSPLSRAPTTRNQVLPLRAQGRQFLEVLLVVP